MTSMTPQHSLSQLADSPSPRLHRRFDRTARLVGVEAMERLAQSHVAIFGVGGVGSFAAEALARSGVGHLTLVDFDSICVTNVNRQLHALKSTLGQPKAEVLAERLRAINPEARIDAAVEFYNADNAERLVTKDLAFVVDAIDNVKAKLHLLARCLQLGLRVVTCMGSAGRLDPTAVRVTDLHDTHTDQFAKDVRKYLRAKHGIAATEAPTGILAVWSTEPCRDPLELPWDALGHVCVCPHKANSPHSCDHRNQTNGSAGFVTGTFGMVAASVVVNNLAFPREETWYPRQADVDQHPNARQRRLASRNARAQKKVAVR